MKRARTTHRNRRAAGVMVALGAALALSLGGAQTANAWSISSFMCKDRGDRIKCAITIDGAKGKYAHFDVKWETDDGRASRTVRDGGRRIPYKSNRTSFTFDDTFTSELWWTQGVVTIGGTTKRSKWRSIYID